jgi:hypothetical protein
MNLLQQSALFFKKGDWKNDVTVLKIPELINEYSLIYLKFDKLFWLLKLFEFENEYKYIFTASDRFQLPKDKNSS